ncbi:olfactory receptor 2AP1-like [Paroedura picta]|uniref:olfactory receptor 2AP1-like n=1 Tax=Paroedura picta TaxID=143630 RepID=UPI004056E301
METRQKQYQNATIQFILVGFGDLQHLQFPLFLLFLATYIVTMSGNLLILILVATSHHLHTPMYFFLGNLSCMEICYSSTIVPKIMTTVVAEDKALSVNDCFVQHFFFGFLLGAECYLLSAMSYDRYLAICKPLHYATLMNNRVCIQLSAISWFSGLLGSIIMQILIGQLSFCGPNEIDHYFCDNDPLYKLSCTDTSLIELMTLIEAFLFTMPPFFLTVASYVYIITTILRIPSSSGRKKAFSTCSSHLIVVSSFYGSIMIVYMLPNTDAMRELNKFLSVLYTVLPPLINPLIYSLRNQEVKKALRLLLRKIFGFQLRAMTQKSIFWVSWVKHGEKPCCSWAVIKRME